MRFGAWMSLLLAASAAATAVAQEVPGEEGPDGREDVGEDGGALGDAGHPVLRRAPRAGKAPFRAGSVRRLAPLDVAGLEREDAAEDASGATGTGPRTLERVGVVRRFASVHAPRRFDRTARTELLADGSRVWTFDVHAPGARGLRLRASRFDLPPGATLVAVNADDPDEGYGPFEGRGRSGGRAFWLPTVFGERVQVEVTVPAASAGRRVRVSFDRVAQNYRAMEGGRATAAQQAARASVACAEDVACDPSFDADVSRAVALVGLVKNGRHVRVCTGSLLSDADPATTIPWFLTAAHAGVTRRKAGDAEFFFDYKASVCGGPAPKIAKVPRVAGATLARTSVASDVTLLRLSRLPSRRFLLGWRASYTAPGTEVVGVHHPLALTQRISRGAVTGVFDQIVVVWRDGVTAPGSSGSPLLTADKRVIGQLQGGTSYCDTPQGPDVYGRFDLSYLALFPFLDPLDAADPGDDVPAGATLLVPDGSGALTPVHHVGSATDAEDWFAFDAVAGHRYSIRTPRPADVRAEILDESGVRVATDTGDAHGGDAHGGGASGDIGLDHLAQTTGRYLVRVRAAAAAKHAVAFALRCERVDVVTTPPEAPRNVEIRRLADDTRVSDLEVRWADVAVDDLGFRLEGSDDGTVWRELARRTADRESAPFPPASFARFVRVVAWNAVGDAPSAAVEFVGLAVDDTDVPDPSADRTLLRKSEQGSVLARTLSFADPVDTYVLPVQRRRRYEIRVASESEIEVTVIRGRLRIVRVPHHHQRGNSLLVATSTASRLTIEVRAPSIDPNVVTQYALTWRRDE